MNQAQVLTNIEAGVATITLNRPEAMNAFAGVIAGIKRGTYLGVAGSPDDVLACEHAEQRERFVSADSREGMRAFLEKRAPKLE